MSQETTKSAVSNSRNPNLNTIISQENQDFSYSSLDSFIERENSINRRKNNTDGNKDVMFLSYYRLMMFLFIITVNQSLLHLHLLDEKNAFFIQKSPKNVIHFALLAILAYLIFTYKHISQKNKKQKTTLIFITTILIISNVLLLVKSLTSLSLSYLPLAMIGCFLMILTIFRIQQKTNAEDSPSRKNLTDLPRPSNIETIQTSNIETIQICIGLLGLSAIIFELIYDKALTNITIRTFKLEAPELAHYLCMGLQFLTALSIIVCLVVKKRLDARNNSSIKKEQMLDTEQYIVFPDNGFLPNSPRSKQSSDDEGPAYLKGKTARSFICEFEPDKSFMERMEKIKNNRANNDDDDSSYTETSKSYQ